MSAITGILKTDGSVKTEQIRKMNYSLSHRGPDDSGIWCDGTVGLGHQMLWTTPESVNEKLPMVFQHDNLVITADARIDNRDELLSELGIIDGNRVTDSEIILRSYMKWGENCPERLLGDFSFAIWDAGNETLYCARDHMGVKPFYYHFTNGNIFFASEIKALFTNSEIQKRINDFRLACYLIQINEYGNQTFFDGIYRLPAAHSLTLNKAKIKIKRYWELNRDSELHLATEEEYIERFRQIFRESVRCRTRTAFPLGFELSGGLDSSAVVCIAREILRNSTVNTFSNIFKDLSETNEEQYINEVAKLGRLKSNLFNSDEISPLKNIDEILWHTDEPCETHNIAIIWNLCREIQKQGVRVLLGGQDGDTTLWYGQMYFYELFETLKWKKLAHELNLRASNMDKSSLKLFFAEVLYPMAPYHVKKVWRQINGFRVKPDTYMLKKNFVDEIEANKMIHELYLDPEKKANNSKKFHYFLLNLNSNQTSLEEFDRVASAFNIEPRYPFYDKRLIEFCYSLPSELKFEDGWDRMIMRKALEDILPKKVAWRPSKAEFRHYFDRNMLLYEKNRLDKIFKGNNSKNLKVFKKYVDLNKAQEIYNKYQSGSYGADSDDLWTVLNLFIYYEKLTCV